MTLFVFKAIFWVYLVGFLSMTPYTYSLLNSEVSSNGNSRTAIPAVVLAAFVIVVLIAIAVSDELASTKAIWGNGFLSRIWSWSRGVCCILTPRIWVYTIEPTVRGIATCVAWWVRTGTPWSKRMETIWLPGFCCCQLRSRELYS